MFSKMIKVMFVTLLFAIGSISCSACAKKVPVVNVPDAEPSATVPPVTPPTNILVKENDWQFVLPGTNWDKLEMCTKDGCPVLYQNKDKKSAIVFLKNPYEYSYDDFIITSIRGVKDAGGVISSAKQIELNGRKFVLVESVKNYNKVWMWLTLLNGQGYALSCGGSGDNHDLCFTIASTFKIN
jgi:hypothetical protein